MHTIDAIDAIMRLGPVIPVLLIDDVRHARPIAEALVRGGLTALEVTLRTSAAIEAIREMRNVAGACVGAGTVLNPTDLRRARDSGAQFIVSPDLTDALAEAVNAAEILFLPGVSTASDIMGGLDLGLTHFKFFPAMASGGIPVLKALAAPFAHARFCPTGGITAQTAGNWLALPEVLCVGGSWLVLRGVPDLQMIEHSALRILKLVEQWPNE